MKEHAMSDIQDDILQTVGGDMDFFKKILSKIPGFKGYMERQQRRDADKLLRDMVANRFEEQWQRVSALQREFISQGEIGLIDDLEAAAVKLRTFADRVRRATRGYSSLFEAVKIGGDELARLYAFDAALLDLADEVGRAVDNIEASIGSEGLMAAIRNLVSISRRAIDTFDKREEIFVSEAPAAQG
jgi:hypothetical protein